MSDTFRQLRVALRYEVDRSSVQQMMRQNSQVRKALKELAETFPENMRAAARKSADILLSEMSKATEREFKQRDKAHTRAIMDDMKREKDLEAFRQRIRQNSYSMQEAAERAHQVRMTRVLRDAENQRAQIIKAQAQWASTLSSMPRPSGSRGGAARGVTWDPRAGTFVPNQVPQGGYNRMGLMDRMGANVGGYLSLGAMGGIGIAGPAGVAASAIQNTAGRLYQSGKQEYESDFAIRRMMTLVAPRERGGYSQGRGGEEAKSLARELGIDIPHAADAMREALTNAIPPESIKSFATMANSLAIMEGADLTDTIRALASIRNAFGLTEREFKDVPNIIFAALDEGNLKLHEMSDQIGQLGAIAEQAGSKGARGFKEMMAGLSAITLKGIHGDPAAVGMRSVYTNILNPSEEAKKEQERIGMRMTPALVQSRGLVQAMQEFDGAIKRAGSSWARAFSGETRTLKVLNYLVANGGEDVKRAMAAQNEAITNQRAAQANSELMNSPEMRSRQLGERFSQMGQAAGSGFYGFGQTLGQGLASAGELYTGTTALNDRKAQQERVIARARADRQHQQRMRTGLTREEMEEMQARDQASADELDTSLAGTNQVFREGRALKANQVFHAYKKRVQQFGDEHAAAQALAGQGMSTAETSRGYWLSRSEGLQRLEHGMTDTTSKRRSAYEQGLTGAGGLDQFFGTIDRTRELNGLATNATNPEEMVRLRNEAAETFGGVANFDVLGVARKGFNQRDLSAMIERRVGARGLRGYEGMQARRGMYQQASGLEKTISSAYNDFSKTNLPDSDFASWYANRGQNQVSGGAMGEVKSAQSEAESKYGLATQAYKDFKTYSDSIAENWQKVRDSVEASAAVLNAMNPESSASVQDALGLISAQQQVGDTQMSGINRVKLDKSGIEKRLAGFKYKEDRLAADVGFGASPVAGTQTITDNRTVEVKMEVTVPPGTDPKIIAKMVADGLVVKIREELDRGRSTLQTPK